MIYRFILMFNNAQESKEYLKHLIENLRQEIGTSRINGQSTNYVNIILHCILELINHDQKYGTTETIEERRQTLYGIERLATMLPSGALCPGESNDFRDRYTDCNKMSIWRDIQFLINTDIVPLNVRAKGHKGYRISDKTVIKILEEDIKLLEKAIKFELENGKQNSSKDYEQYAHYKFRNIYETVNYYRDKESLNRVLEVLQPDFLDTIKANTQDGKLAVFRLLEIVGEFCSKKDLSSITRNLDITIDWELLVAIRNGLAHHEWYLTGADIFKNLLQQDMTAIFDDISLLRWKLSALKNNLDAIELHGRSHYRLFDRRISDYFVQRSFSFNTDIATAIQEYTKWLLQENFIDEKKSIKILGILALDIETENLFSKLQNIIGVENFSKDTLRNLSTSRQIEYSNIMEQLKQIEGELLPELDVNKAKSKLQVLAKQFQGLIEQDLKKTIDSIQSEEDCNTAIACIYSLGLMISKEYIKILQLNKKIRSRIKLSDNIKELYQLLKDLKYIQEDNKDLSDILKDIQEKKIEKSEGSKKIDPLKLSVIQTTLQRLNLDTVDDKKLNFSVSFYQILDFINPPVNESIKCKIQSFCDQLLNNNKILTEEEYKKIGVELTSLNQENAQNILEQLNLAISKKYTQEEVKKLKGKKYERLEEMQKKSGVIADLFKKELDSLERRKNSIKKHSDVSKESLWEKLREFKKLLPNEPENQNKDYKIGNKSFFEQAKVINSIVNAIELLKKLFSSDDSKLDIDHAFPEEVQFVEIPENVWQKSEGKYNDDDTYAKALQEVQQSLGTTKKIVPLQSRIMTDIDDIDFRKRKTLDKQFENHLEGYLNKDVKYIKDTTILYANFYSIRQHLKKNPVLNYAVQYSVSIVWSYLNELQQEFLEFLPEYLQKQFKALRNVVKHGNIYAELLASDGLENYYVRYASIFIHDLALNFKQLQDSFLNVQSHSNDENKDLWYDDQQIRFLLQQYLNPDECVVMASTVFEGTNLLKSNVEAAIHTANNGQTAVMPINLHSNHWVGVIIRRDGNSRLQFIYQDPLGHSIENEPNALALMLTLTRVTHEAGLALDHIDLSHRQQNNGNDCGPFTVSNLISLASNTAVPFEIQSLITLLCTPTEQNANHLREKYRPHLEEYQARQNIMQEEYQARQNIMQEECKSRQEIVQTQKIEYEDIKGALIFATKSITNQASSNSDLAGNHGSQAGSPIRLNDLLVNAELLGVEIAHNFPPAEENYKYLIVDSDNHIREYKSNREDIEIIYQDIQGNTASCGDNALLAAKKAKELGFESYVYVANGHAVALIRYDEKLDHQTILQMITTTELQEEAALWEKYVEVMTGNILYLGNSKEAILQEFGRILKDKDTTEEEVLGARIETLLVKMDSANIADLNILTPVLQELLGQINESKELKTELDTNNLDTLYNNLIAYITDFAGTATAATKTLLQSLLLSVEAEFLNPLQSSPNYFSPYYPPGRPDDEPDYVGSSSGSGGQNPNDNYALMIAGNSTNHSMVQ